MKGAGSPDEIELITLRVLLPILSTRHHGASQLDWNDILEQKSSFGSSLSSYVERLDCVEPGHASCSLGGQIRWLLISAPDEVDAIGSRRRGTVYAVGMQDELRQAHDGAFRPVITSAIRITSASAGTTLLDAPQPGGYGSSKDLYQQVFGAATQVILPHRIIQGHWCRLGAASLSWAEGSASGVAITLVCIVSKEGLLFHPVLLGSLSSALVFELAGS